MCITLLYISLPSLHDYDVKMPNLTFYRGSTQATTKFPLFSELGYGSSKFNFGRVHLLLTKLVTWGNRDEDWKNANSIFQRRFRCRRRPWTLKSLISDFATAGLGSILLAPCPEIHWFDACRTKLTNQRRSVFLSRSMNKREETADISDCVAVEKELLAGVNPVVGSFF